MSDLSLLLIQTDPAWENPSANLKLPPDVSGKIPEGGIVVLPEMFSTGYTMNTALAEKHPGPAALWLLENAARYKAVFTGSVMVQEGDRFFNRFYWAAPDGNLAWYDKKHLFTLAGEEKVFSRGSEQVIISWQGWQVALFVCYDLRFPVWCRRRPDFNYDLALFVASWPDRRGYAWRQLLKARAIENQAYVAAVNRCGLDGNGVLHAGDSMVIDYAGHTLAAVKPFHPGYCLAKLSLRTLKAFREALPFEKDADPFHWV
jgi:predicted amidohydrolase